ncbi:hypothetical protein DUI87_14299 [Hirundo rustica rustica]|uniref:DUF7064 domain-containing protein n=1 Tax=Hirundo rustica rustica TaxID=333673 RepID=A0A3M0K9S5_HIRRU|nr:hypothetical protein DUI87_14299 [Hirundo rustica rustica]
MPALPALLALVAAALLALLGAGRAAGPGAWALDSLYFTGFAETNRTFVIARLARRPAGLCEMWLFLRLDGIGEFEHPEHPNMMVRDESKEVWSGGGLTMEYLEPQMCWKINFDGLLRWVNSTDVFNFNVDSNPRTFARALAQEPWTIKLFQRVKSSFQNQWSRQRKQHFRHEQWGQAVGEIETGNCGKTELSLKGIRSHSYGVRNWAEISRYVMILAHFEDGTAAHLTVINMPATTTHLTVGYVFFPDGRKAGIEWSNASLAELAEDGVIQEEYGVSFTAGGESFDVSAALDKQTCPVVYNGLTGRGVFHECIADFQLNGSTPGWGVVEFYYRLTVEEALIEFKEEYFLSEAVLTLITATIFYAEWVHENEMIPPAFVTCVAQFGTCH